ncbi:TonB-dependent receptor domain-containing protein, partial [Acinetobacter baumannii]
MLLGAANILHTKYPDIQFLIPAINDARKQQIEQGVEQLAPQLKAKIHILENTDSESKIGRMVMNASDIIALASGTATLEAMLMHRPMVTFYKLHWLTYLIAKFLVKIPYYSLPNIIAGKKVIEELIQADATPEYTGYMSYTSIFRPQTGIDKDTNQALKPIEGKSYEMGVKSSWLDDRLTGTLSVFKTEQNNYPLRNSDGNPLNRKVPTSDLESQGVEVGLSGQITDNVNLSFGYAQFSIKDTKNGGEARTYNPNQTLNLLTTYTPPVLPKLKVGAGLQWQDGIKLYDSNVNGTIKQDAYALVNLMASYEVNDHITLQANGNNIFDKKYLNSFPDGQAFYGAPANYTV